MMHAVCVSDRPERSVLPCPLEIRPSSFAARPLPLFCLLLAAAIVGFALPAAAGPYTDAGHPPLAMTAWASGVDALVRGPLDIAQPAGGFASFGVAANALGVASGNALDVVSLGDGGSVTLHFAQGLHNGPGDDLAVFENGFPYIDGVFGELAYVEVSSDGVDFAAFPAAALNDAPVASFDPLDPTAYHGLAGRHEIGLGTGFDLAALAAHPLVASGLLDLMDVRHVRITDVVGDGSRVDAAGRPIYDPYPTPFTTGGFDLDAVGAIHVVEPTLASGLFAGSGSLICGRRRRRSSDASPSSTKRPIARRLRPLATRFAALGAGMLFAFSLAVTPALALTASFDDLGLAPNSALNGSTLAGGFTSGGIFFENSYDATFDVFSGFAASTKTDTTTPGFGNQFSNITGSGVNGSAAFGIAFFDARIVLPEATVVSGAWFTNTTYAALSMKTGDAFSKRFGGATGTDPDFFRLLVDGIDANGGSTGRVELMLADFRSADGALDFIVDDWVFLDLSGLGAVRELRFGFESSDVGAFGINTPTYFAIDDLVTIPEPGPAALLGLGLALLAAPLRPRPTR